MDRNVILQAFNQSFQEIEQGLPELHQLGYRYVLISPPQRSHSSEAWWGRYQPVDFTEISGPLGDKDALVSLCNACNALSIGVLVDVVLNHMTNESRWVDIDEQGVVACRLPRYSVWDFRPRHHGDGDTGTWLGESPDRPDVIGLPDLLTETNYVRLEARAYLRRLVRFGVSGFRFDAAKHMEVDFWKNVLAGLSGLFIFGEFANWNPEDFHMGYLDLMDAYDFTLARTMREALGWGGDLRDLINPATHRRALSGTAAVTFVKTHDILERPGDWEAYTYANEEDELLAYAYILARREGTPYIFLDKYNHPEIRAGIAFNNEALGKTESWLQEWCDPNHLALRRGRGMLAALNKTADDWSPHPISTGLTPGVYRELISDIQYTVTDEGEIQGFHVPARKACYLTKQL